MSVEKTRADKLKETGIKNFGSEEAWRASRAAAGRKGAANRKKPGGFFKTAKENPELHRELSSRAGKTSKRGKSADKKTVTGQEVVTGEAAS